MKKNLIINALAAAAILPSLISCSKNDGPDYSLMYPNAIVTVKPVDETSFFLQLNDETALLPVGETKVPFDGKEVRAFVNFSETDMPEGADRDKFAKAVKIRKEEAQRVLHILNYLDILEQKGKKGRSYAYYVKDI